MIERRYSCIIAAGAALLAAGCGTIGQTAMLSAPTASSELVRPAETHDAGRVAAALAQGDAAYAGKDMAALKLALGQLDALGAAPMDEAQDDLLAQWRVAVPELDPPMRGRALGPAYRKGQVIGQGKDTIDQLFLSGKKASVALEGPGGTRPELAIFDAQNRPVCGPKDKDRRCQWIPVFTQRYRIEIANPGAAALRYYLVIE